MQIEYSGGPAPAQDTASALFGVAGLRVIEVDTEPGGQVTVWVMAEGPAACPCCGTVPEHVHEWVVTRPRDVRRGMDPVAVCWVKRRWACGEEQCPRQTFTESVPQLAPRCRITARLREQVGAEVADRGITRPRRPGTPGSPGRWSTRRSPRRRTRCWISRTHR